MDHLAILNKKQQWLEKILAGEKTIESRWYKSRRTPWNTVSKGDNIYFKYTGNPVKARAEVEQVLYFDHPNKEEINSVLKRYARAICIEEDYKEEYQKYNYIILVFLKNPQAIPSFSINKTGYGMGNAWITLKDINQIKVYPK